MSHPLLIKEEIKKAMESFGEGKHLKDTFSKLLWSLKNEDPHMYDLVAELARKFGLSRSDALYGAAIAHQALKLQSEGQ